VVHHNSFESLRHYDVVKNKMFAIGLNKTVKLRYEANLSIIAANIKGFTMSKCGLPWQHIFKRRQVGTV